MFIRNIFTASCNFFPNSGRNIDIHYYRNAFLLAFLNPANDARCTVCMYKKSYYYQDEHHSCT